MDDLKVLVVESSASYCGVCGWGAFPHEESHQTLAGWGVPYDRKGCGAQWNAIGTRYYDFNGLWKSIQDVRPDLEFVGLYFHSRIPYEELPPNEG
jgi:hypothetical protein